MDLAARAAAVAAAVAAIANLAAAVAVIANLAVDLAQVAVIQLVLVKGHILHQAHRQTMATASLVQPPLLHRTLHRLHQIPLIRTR